MEIILTLTFSVHVDAADAATAKRELRSIASTSDGRGSVIAEVAEELIECRLHRNGAVGTVELTEVKTD